MALVALLVMPQNAQCHKRNVRKPAHFPAILCVDVQFDRNFPSRFPARNGQATAAGLYAYRRGADEAAVSSAALLSGG
jgi:hypothetical protein